MLDEFIQNALQEDLGSGDHSSLACVPLDAQSAAYLLIKESGVLAGVDVAKRICEIYDATIIFDQKLKDGDRIQTGDIAFTLQGSSRSILAVERLLLNCMQHMSGVATQTAHYVQLISGTNCTLLDTRKTTPGMRLLDKYAVKIGGGANHRFGLYDMIMLKDNHIDFCGGLEKAIEKAWNYTQLVNPLLKIEVEARSLDDVKKILLSARGKVFRIMLDNFTPKELDEAVILIKREGGFETEASGGINLQNIRDYAASGVDYISVGALIHQAKSLDLSLKAIKE